MKTKLLLVTVVLAVATVTRAANLPTSSAPRVGIYDSRAVAFAYFWSDSARRERDDLIARAKAAKASGDRAEFDRLNAQLVGRQKRDHLQVFSTAPADGAMAALQPRLTALLGQLNVTRLVSKWDEASLTTIPESDRFDVTDALAHEFLPAPTDRQSGTLKAMKTTPPIPLAEATKLADEGKM